MEIGVYAFADTAPDPRTGVVVSPERRLRDLIEEMELAEKLDLLLRLRGGERVTWAGRHRPSLDDRGVHPQDPPPVWLAVGGTPNSVIRAGVLGLPLALAVIGGMPERFVPLIRLYRDAAREAGHDPGELPVGLNEHVYPAETSKRAADELYPSYAASMNRIGRERGWSPMTREQYDGMREPRGSLVVAAPPRSSRRSSSSTSSSGTGASWRRRVSGRFPTTRSCTPSNCRHGRRAGRPGRGRPPRRLSGPYQVQPMPQVRVTVRRRRGRACRSWSPTSPRGGTSWWWRSR